MDTPTPDPESRFRALFDSTYPDVLRFARRRVAPSQAEDVAAETFLVAWRRLEDAPARHGDVRAWLFGIARNCILNSRREQTRREALAVRLADVTPGPVSSGDPDHVAHRLDLAVAWRTLSDTDQEALALTVLDDLTSSEAARVLGTTPTAYRLRLMRARRALRSSLEPAPAAHLPLETRS